MHPFEHARGRLEHALRREDVAAQVRAERVAEAAYAGLAREVEDAVDTRELELVLGEVDAPDVEAARVLLLQARVVVVREAVETDDLVAFLETLTAPRRSRPEPTLRSGP